MKTKRNDLQQEAKRHQFSMRMQYGGMQQNEYHLMKDAYQKANRCHEEMASNSIQIDSIGDRINGLNQQIIGLNRLQKEAFDDGKKILDSVFGRLKKKRNAQSKKIDRMGLQIEKTQKAIDETREKIDRMHDAWRELCQGLDDLEKVSDNLDAFYDQMGLPEEERSSLPLETIQKSFSLFRFLLDFRELFEKTFTPLDSGPLPASRLGKILRELNEKLALKTGQDLFRFLEHCESAVEEFEADMLNTTERWNGMPIYALRQMFRILTLICQGPFGFAGRVDLDGKTPKITFHTLDPAVRFQDAWHDLRPPVLASATLSPVEDVAKILGLGNGFAVKIPPVFPLKNYLSFAFLGCHSSMGMQDGAVFNSLEQQILKMSIIDILAATRRHTGLFCASHNVLDAVLDQLSRRKLADCGMYLLVGRSDPKPIRDDFTKLKRFAPELNLQGMGEFDARLALFMELAGKVPVVMICVSGGGMGEGVDFKGEAMEMAIIIGIPYQDEGDRAWINERRTAFFKMRTGKLETGKDLAYRQSALRKIAQTAGRVHRTNSDRGAIVFFDERLLGLKNSAPSGHARYEVLNADNTRKHWKIIQSRILEALKVVVPDGFDPGEAEDLSKFIRRVYNGTGVNPEIISYDTMLDLLSGFFNGS